MKQRKKSLTIFGDKISDYSFIYKGKNSNIFLDNHSKKNTGIGESKFMDLSNVSIIEKSENNNQSFLDYSEKDKDDEISFLNKLDMINSKELNKETNKKFYEEDFFFKELNNMDENNSSINMKKNSESFSKNLKQFDSNMFRKKFDIKEVKSYKKSDIKEKGFKIFFE